GDGGTTVDQSSPARDLLQPRRGYQTPLPGLYRVKKSPQDTPLRFSGWLLPTDSRPSGRGVGPAGKWFLERGLSRLGGGHQRGRASGHSGVSLALGFGSELRWWVFGTSIAGLQVGIGGCLGERSTDAELCGSR